MKILHICTGWPLSYQGGITNYVRKLAQTQHENGLEVCVLGAPDKVKYPFKYVEFKSTIVPFTYTPLEDKDSLSVIQKLLETEMFDIIHIHALEYVDWDIYEVVKKYKYIVSLHDYCFICPRIYMYTPDGEVCSAYNRDKCKKCISYLDRFGKIRRFFEKFRNLTGINIHTPYIPQKITEIRYKKFINLLNHAAYILPVSHRVDEIYKASGVTSPSKVLHIGNLSADKYSDVYTYDGKPHKIKSVFLGRLSEYKGANLFIKIADKLKTSSNIEFHFLGYSGEYADQLKSAGIVDHGKYNQNELANLLKDYDLGMVLSVWEDNGPQVVMELLNNHIPVIGTKMGGIQDFVTMENGYIFDPYNEAEIDKLCKFLDNVKPGDIAKLKKNIKRTTTSKEHYDELIEVYKEVLLNH